MAGERIDRGDVRLKSQPRFEGLCGKGILHTARDGGTWMAQYLDDLGEWNYAWGFGKSEQGAIDNLWSGLTRFSFD